MVRYAIVFMVTVIILVFSACDNKTEEMVDMFGIYRPFISGNIPSEINSSIVFLLYFFQSKSVLSSSTSGIPKSIMIRPLSESGINSTQLPPIS